jgi:hypothetical protein
MQSNPKMNRDFELASQYVCYTDSSIFLTGKAGTGKTTFLKHIAATCTKKMAIVAPTGVAAINAGGTTIHSFFQLPFGSYISDYRTEWGGGAMEINNKNSLLKNLKLNQVKRQAIQEIELLIIDEVSMLRADLLDAIDTVMRYVRNKEHLPFGGVQILFIGDLYQLPPVVNREEWQVLSAYYASPFFFDATVLRNYPILNIELKKVYRQQDEQFIGLLNAIRNNNITTKQLEALNNLYQPFYESNGFITLTSHNAKADAINKNELELLSGKTFSYEAKLTGEFNEKNVPVDKNIILKEGAQVMFVKNDKGDNRRYYNGKIGKIAQLLPDKIIVTIDNSQDIELELETWKNIQYKYNHTKDEIEEEELGSFSQFPIRLAWAITIHKSQGLTFEKAIIDAGASFAAGQVYVALSRLKSIQGLVLATKIGPEQIMTDERIVAYVNQFSDVTANEKALLFAQQQYAQNKLQESFDFSSIAEGLKKYYQSLEQSAIPEKAPAVQLWFDTVEQWNNLHEVAGKFQAALVQHFSKYKVDYTFIAERCKAAHQYFDSRIDQLIQQLQQHINNYSVKPRTKKYISNSKIELLNIIRKKQEINDIVIVSNALSNKEDLGTALNQIASEKNMLEKNLLPESTINTKKEVGNSKFTTLELHQQGHSIESIAHIRSMAVSTIEGHLIHFISTGEVDITKLVSNEKLSLILQLIKATNSTTASSLKEQLGESFSYGEIRAAIAYHSKLLAEG